MKSKAVFSLLTTSIVMTLFTSTNAFGELSIIKKMKLEMAPLDTAISANGRWIFVLTDQGEILVYSADGVLNDRIPIEKSIDGIEAGPREDILFLSSRAKKTVDIVTFDFARKINTSGSPSMGPDDAPVVIAVFSDFE